MVVAKGKNYLALRIRQKAIENQVPLIENPPLAQALYKSVDVGQEIPAQLYRAVAEMLAYIFKLMNRKKRIGTDHPEDSRATALPAAGKGIPNLPAAAARRNGRADRRAGASSSRSSRRCRRSCSICLIVVDIMMSVIVMMVSMYIRSRWSSASSPPRCCC